MKDYILVQARTESKRFKNKILKKINKKSILEILIERIKKTLIGKNIIVLTTKKKADQKIVKLCKLAKIKFFRGSENDLVKRYTDCVKRYKISNIIRITSDCPFIDPKLINKFYLFYKKNKFQYVSNTTPPNISTFPDGSDIEIFSRKILFWTNKNCKNYNDREHLTNFMWKNKKFNNYNFKNYKNLSKYRFSIDYPSDYKSIKKIFNILKKKNQYGYTKEIIKILKSNKNINDVLKKNKKLYIENRMDLK